MQIRADFDFSDIENKIKKCVGYIIGEYEPTETGSTFRPIKTVVSKLIATAPNFEVVEHLALKHCEVEK